MQSFLSSKLYFVFCLGLGFAALYSVAGEPIKPNEPIQLSSLKNNSLYSAELNSFEASLEDREISETFTLLENDVRARGNESQHILSYAELNAFDRQMELLSAPVTQVQDAPMDYNYESPRDCSAESLEIEKSLNTTPAVTDLIQERPVRGTDLPRECVIFVMKSMKRILPTSRIAKCSRGAHSEPEREGPQVCLTKSLVNATYNSYLDVAECLGLNPKDILPKLANESGLLINTYGGGSDAGVGQLTRTAIDEVNSYYTTYLNRMTMKAKTNPACARVMNHKSLLAPVAKELTDRCGLIVAPENPLKNIVYMGILNKINANLVRLMFTKHGIIEKMAALGLNQVDSEQLIEAMAMAGYNCGVSTSFGILNKYLDQRIKAGLKLKASDFNFFNLPIVYDEISLKERDLLGLARSYVLATYIGPTDTEEIKKAKIQKIKLLPRKIKESYKLTFPEFFVYNQNNFDGVSDVINANFKNIGAPGYLTFLAMNHTNIKNEFQGKGIQCSNPNYLKFK